jgi:hypothetical protein
MSATARTGMRTPVHECTQVIPSTRVLGPDRIAQRADDAVHRDRARIFVDRHATRLRLRLLACEADRLVRRVVVVGRGEHLVARLERQPRVDHRQTLRRAVGERDLVALGAQVGRHLVADRELQVVLVAREPEVVHLEERIRVDRLAVRRDRVAHRARMRREEEARHVIPARRQVELRAHGCSMTRRRAPAACSSESRRSGASG